MMDEIEIFKFLAAKAAIAPTALVTVTRVEGSSMRNPGAHLAVAGDGSWCGSLSGGCIEAAVIAEALDALGAGVPREVRFGNGSPYIDIRLPCGGSLDVLVSPIEDASLGERAVDLFAARQPFSLRLPIGRGPVCVEAGEKAWRTRRDAETFSVSYLPPLAVVIIGHGASVEALEVQARTAGAITRVLTPDRAITARLERVDVPFVLLRMAHERVNLAADRWTAIAFLFHDHDWETALMAEALASPAFYVGAMGSRAAHARRSDLLRGAGVPEENIALLHAPIGLIPSSRDPQVLALSVLAEIIRDFGTATARSHLTIDAGDARAEDRAFQKAVP